MADLDTYDADQRGYDDERDYPPRDRSRSPDRERDRDGDTRVRDEPTNGRSDRDHSNQKNSDDPDATNPGSNLFVTGIHPRLTEEEVSRLFEKYGQVEKCNIMRDPHTRESRGFGFVKMVTAEEADAAKEALQGETYEGRTLSIEKARRARPRTPTPGKYFGPPKRGSLCPHHDRDAPVAPMHRAFRSRKPVTYPGTDDRRPPRGGHRDNYYDDRGYGRRDDHYRRGGGGGGYRDRYDDRGYGRRDDHGPRIDRYASSRDDRYGDRRGGGGGDRGYGGGGYDREPRGPPPESSGGYGDSAGGRDPPSRSYDDRRRYD